MDTIVKSLPTHGTCKHCGDDTGPAEREYDEYGHVIAVMVFDTCPDCFIELTTGQIPRGMTKSRPGIERTPHDDWYESLAADMEDCE